MPDRNNVLSFPSRPARAFPAVEITLGPKARPPATVRVRPDQLLAGRVIEEMTRGWTPFERKAISAAIAEGILQGRPSAAIVSGLRIPKPRNVAAVVHSAAMSASAELREALLTKGVQS